VVSIVDLRREYHLRVCNEIIRTQKDTKKREYPNFADGTNRASIEIAWGIVNRLNFTPGYESLTGQTTGGRFEVITKDFLKKAFKLLHHLRPGDWVYSTQLPISKFDQYEHLAELEEIIKQNSDLASALGRGYIIAPDIVVGRWPIPDEEINTEGKIISRSESIAKLTPLRSDNYQSPRLTLHASISCKWILRSDRSQNARTEALNLIRNRKGLLPHVVAVTAEPLPTRIASLALGTGDLDCVYHFALYELEDALKQIDNEDQIDMLSTLVEGRRLRDISDLPFDLAI